MLFEALEKNANSKPWHSLLILSLCIVGAIGTRILVHRSSAALTNQLRTSPALSAPAVPNVSNVRVRESAPKQ